ncbi:hypothetical protein AAFJ72_20150 [Brevibacillus gelatini]|uniref:hypothetical protein n=1 Tax=Brevibacillus gelatini TaxID=1655277 RepID=UPI003D81720E
MKKFILGTIATTLSLASLAFTSNVMASPNAASPEKVDERQTLTEQDRGAQINRPDSINGIKDKGMQRATKKPVNDFTIAADTQHTIDFDIPKGYGWVKVYVQNTGKADINVVVINNVTGEEMLSGVAKPGKSFSKISSSPWGADEHSISLTSVENMSGSVSVKLAQKKSELQ